MTSEDKIIMFLLLIIGGSVLITGTYILFLGSLHGFLGMGVGLVIIALAVLFRSTVCILEESDELPTYSYIKLGQKDSNNKVD